MTPIAPECNLIEGVYIEDIQDDLDNGSGNELKGKFRAVHSSSALAANTFGFFKKTGNARHLTLNGMSGFTKPKLEKKLPTGLGGTPPNLDVFLENETTVIGLESKFLEHITPKSAKFSGSYDQKEKLSVEDCWWNLLQNLKDDPSNRGHLDVAQLIKHYLGLRKQYAGKGKQVILIYLFWEPENWQDFPAFRTHRSEVNEFQGTVSNSEVEFRSQSYPELWSDWTDHPSLKDHLARLGARYRILI